MSQGDAARRVNRWITHFIIQHRLCPYAHASLPSFEVFQTWERDPIPAAVRLSHEIASAGDVSEQLHTKDTQGPQLSTRRTDNPPLSNFMFLLRHRSFRQFAAFDQASSRASQALAASGAAHRLAFFHPRFPEHSSGTQPSKSTAGSTFPTDVFVARAPYPIWHFLPVDDLVSIQNSKSSPSGNAGQFAAKFCAVLLRAFSRICSCSP